MARTAVNLADTLAATGRYAEAEHFYADALETYERAFGPRAQEVASTLEEMAALLRKTHREEKADALGGRAQSIRFELEHVVRAEQLH